VGFAAEFLLTREHVGGAFDRQFEAIDPALSEPSRRFNVGREVAVLEVRNFQSWFDLSEEEKSYLLRMSEG